VEAANEFAAFVAAQQYSLKDTVYREALNCEFEMRRSYDVYIDEKDAKEAEKLYRTAIKEGHQWARDLDFVGPEFAEQVYQFIPLSSSGRILTIKGHFHPRRESSNQYAVLQPLALQICHSTPLKTRRLRLRNPLHAHSHPFHHRLQPLNHIPSHPSRQPCHQETNLRHKCLYLHNLSSIQKQHYTLQRNSLPHCPCKTNFTTSE
jgi:hypothetical protein